MSSRSKKSILMIEHENKLNDNIVAQLSALLRRDERPRCCNRKEEQNELRSKTLMDYGFHGYKICIKSLLFLHGIGLKRLRLLCR